MAPSNRCLAFPAQKHLLAAQHWQQVASAIPANMRLIIIQPHIPQSGHSQPFSAGLAVLRETFFPDVGLLDAKKPKIGMRCILYQPLIFQPMFANDLALLTLSCCLVLEKSE
jgi:hypothetical protein